MNLVGDSLHNFLDGIIIAASFIISIPVGIATSIAVLLHEIPQEIGDFGVLIYGGFEKTKALILNFASASTVIIGGIVGFLFSNYVERSTTILLTLAAGGFIYIAASDLIPQIRNEKTLKKTIINFTLFLLGILIMYLIGFVE